MQPCEVQLKEDRVILMQPLLAASGSPKMPRTLFIKACNSVDGIDANELFDQIHQRNTQVLVQLLRQLQGVDGDVAERDLRLDRRRVRRARLRVARRRDARGEPGFG